MKGTLLMLRQTFCLLTLLTTLITTVAFAAEPTPQVVYLWPSGAATLQGANEKEITNPPNSARP